MPTCTNAELSSAHRAVQRLSAQKPDESEVHAAGASATFGRTESASSSSSSSSFKSERDSAIKAAALAGSFWMRDLANRAGLRM